MTFPPPHPQPRPPRDAWRKAPFVLLALLIVGAAFAAPFAVSAVLEDDAAPAARPPAASLEAELGGATPIDAPQDVKASTLGAVAALPALQRPPRRRAQQESSPAPAPVAPAPTPTAEPTPAPTARATAARAHRGAPAAAAPASGSGSDRAAAELRRLGPGVVVRLRGVAQGTGRFGRLRGGPRSTP